MMSSLNTFAIAAAAVSGMALGALWYSPVAFGNAWLAAIGRKLDELGSPTPAMIGSMVVCVITAVTVETLFVMTGGAGLVDGLMIGGMLGFGIVATAMLSDALFSGWGWPLYLIQAGYRVSYLVLMGAIIGLWPR